MHPVLFNLFGRPVYSYGFLLGLGIILGWALAFRWARADGLPVKRLKVVTTVAVLGALFFARVLFLATNPQAWVGPGSLLDFEGGGLVAYGGYLGGFLVGYLGCRSQGIEFLRFMDHVAPCLAFGLMFARLGCFLNGCDYGPVTELPWGVEFPAGSLAHSQHVGLGLVGPGAVSSLPVHPTQLYAAVFGLLLGSGLVAARNRLRVRFRGQLFIAFLVLYAAFRFVVEFLRDDPGRGALAGLSTSQWISIGVLVVLAPVAVRRSRVGGAPGAG